MLSEIKIEKFKGNKHKILFIKKEINGIKKSNYKKVKRNE